MLSVVIAYRPDHGHRDRLWSWVKARYAALLPDVELVVGTDDGGDNPGQFNHPLAFNRGVAAASGDVLLVADADTAFDPEWVLEAARMIEAKEAAWILPRFYDKLSRRATERLLALDSSLQLGDLRSSSIESRVDGLSWSGLLVISREGYDTVGGYDERFARWGADDVCFTQSLMALWGPVTRLEGSATHLWHSQPLDETYGHEDHPRQYALMESYLAAHGDPEAMRLVRFGLG